MKSKLDSDELEWLIGELEFARKPILSNEHIKFLIELLVDYRLDVEEIESRAMKAHWKIVNGNGTVIERFTYRIEAEVALVVWRRIWGSTCRVVPVLENCSFTG
jgi:hypothetical protein